MKRKETFNSNTLDRDVWLPHYLPAWSSRSATQANYELVSNTLRLFIPTALKLWCPETHPEPLRVSGIQSGNRSGPVGSRDGQQRFRNDLEVREAQPRFEGWLQNTGRVAIRCKMNLTPRSMAAMWLSGFEEAPDEAGELCVVEIFGRSVEENKSAEIGCGVKKLYDPRLVQDFVTPRINLDIRDFHTYAVEWGAERSKFYIDGQRVFQSAQAPGYPMQIMIAVFDFPAWDDGSNGDHVPEMVVDWIEGNSTNE
ncbi:MAG: glycoside hydrolase family 16 protein [Anaerolineae bacterium]|nr:glycoside hydrolase family 16 protein [Anaerolineae bacterium]